MSRRATRYGSSTPVRPKHRHSSLWLNADAGFLTYLCCTRVVRLWGKPLMHNGRKP